VLYGTSLVRGSVPQEDIRYYKFVDDDSVFKSVGDVLQELGFALDPKGLNPKNLSLLPSRKKLKFAFIGPT